MMSVRFPMVYNVVNLKKTSYWDEKCIANVGIYYRQYNNIYYIDG